MKLFEAFAEAHYHTSVVTTFGIDFGAYENIVLPRLRGAGCHNNLVLADHQMLAQSLGGAAEPPAEAGRLYGVSSGIAPGAFHPKVFLQLGRKRGRLMLGSANITTAGLAGNLELVNVVRAGKAQPGEQQLVSAAWQYLLTLLDTDSLAVREQLAWARPRAPWVAGEAGPGEDVMLTDGTIAALLVPAPGSGIGEQFVARMDGAVRRLVVLSPYWDPKLEALTNLREALEPAQTAILIDPATRAFPRDAFEPDSGVILYHRDGFRAGRFIHAKLFIAETAEADHVLVGSANCTIAALGKPGFQGTNIEACLYRRLPAGTVLEALGLTTVMTDERRLAAEALPDFVGVETSAEDAPSAGVAGHLEIYADTLTWRPPAAVTEPGACELQLLDRDLKPLPGELLQLSSGEGAPLRYRLPAGEPLPAFVRVRFPGGGLSSPAIVQLVDRLRAVRHEGGSSAGRQALAQLDGMTHAGLPLLEILDLLEKLEAGLRTPGEAAASVARPVLAQEDTEDPRDYPVVSYDQFIARSRPVTEGQIHSHSSLAGSELSIVRSALNRIAGLHDALTVDDGDDDGGAITRALAVGDETDDPEQALERGEELDPADPPTPPPRPPLPDAAARAWQLSRATREHLVAATRGFCERLRVHKHDGAVTPQDLLRLRTLLMVLCTAAKPVDDSESGAGTGELNLQVLAASADADGWPRLMGMLLFAVFGGKDPATGYLKVSDEHDQLQVDVLECWATCYWCFQACLRVTLTPAERRKIDHSLMPLCLTAYRATGLTAEELLSVPVTRMLEALSRTYAGPLGLEPAALVESHRGVVARLFAEAGELPAAARRINTGP